MSERHDDAATTASRAPKRRRRALFITGFLLATLWFARAPLPPPDARLSARCEEVSTARLRRHVSALCAPGPRARSDALAATRAYLTRELSALGYAPREEPFAWTETMSATDLDSGEKQSSSRRHKDRHVLAEKRGLLEPERILEVAAHFDTVPRSPGADDNASGVAALLEVAAALAPLELARTVRFCFFSQEERFLIGSRRHVEAFTARGEQVEGALVLDGVGYTDHRPDSQSSPVWIPLVAWPPSTGDFLLIVGDHRSGGLGDLFEGATARYAPELELYGVKRLGGLFKDAARSDHANYWRAGLPAVLLTDSGNFRNPNYHRPSDTPETLDFEFLTRVTRATAATAASWAGLMRPRN